jgi:hypothetical protein
LDQGRDTARLPRLAPGRRLHATLAPGVQQARLFRHPGTAITQFAPHLAKHLCLT